MRCQTRGDSSGSRAPFSNELHHCGEHTHRKVQEGSRPQKRMCGWTRPHPPPAHGPRGPLCRGLHLLSPVTENYQLSSLLSGITGGVKRGVNRAQGSDRGLGADATEWGTSAPAHTRAGRSECLGEVLPGEVLPGTERARRFGSELPWGEREGTEGREGRSSPGGPARQRVRGRGPVRHQLCAPPFPPRAI